MTCHHQQPTAPPPAGQRHDPPPGQRQRALDLVTQVQQVTGRRHGSATTAARILGIDPATVQKWVRDSRPPPDPPAPVHLLTGLVHCATCQQPLLPGHTADGLRAYRCATGRSCGHIDADHLEQQVGNALLCQAPKATRRHLRATTREEAAAAAAMLLRRITLGPDGQLHLTWHPTGTPSTLANPDLKGGSLPCTPSAVTPPPVPPHRRSDDINAGPQPPAAPGHSPDPTPAAAHPPAEPPPPTRRPSGHPPRPGSPAEPSGGTVAGCWTLR